jgi:ribosomal protein S18 acetylase RimI-like enzyme
LGYLEKSALECEAGASMAGVPMRAAVESDIDELVRLRGVIFAATRGPVQPGEWQVSTAATIRERLSDGSLAAFVVPRHTGGLAACAVGLIERRFGNPRNPSGLVGYVLNVATDTDTRRLGYSLACVTALLDWFAEHGVGRVDLVASEDGERLYRRLGFESVPEPLLSRWARPRSVES